MSKNQTPAPQRISVSAREAAIITGLSKSTIYKLIADGQLPYVQVGGRRLVMVKDLYKFLTDARQCPQFQMV